MLHNFYHLGLQVELDRLQKKQTSQISYEPLGLSLNVL